RSTTRWAAVKAAPQAADTRAPRQACSPRGAKLAAAANRRTRPSSAAAAASATASSRSDLLAIIQQARVKLAISQPGQEEETMGRSLKKGPYVVERLLEKVSRADASGSREPIKTWARACTVVPEFVGKNFSVHNGRNFIKLYITEDMVGHKLGE